MSSRGYIKLHRSLFKHPFFRPAPYCEQAAFSWLLAEAAWKPRQRRVSQFLVELDRGELVASLRHLSDTWMWKVSLVRSFLRRLENSEMVRTRTENGITVVTICNYEVYQGDEAPDETLNSKVSAQSEHGDSTVRARSEHKTEELKHSKMEEGNLFSPGPRAELNDQSPGQGDGQSSQQLALIASPPPKKTKAKKPKLVITHEIQAGFDTWWEACPLKIAKERAFKQYVEVVSTGKASINFLHQQMVKYYADEEQRFVMRRYTEPWQYSYQPVSWFRDGHYGNEVAAITGGQGRPMSSASEGIHSYFDR